MAVKRFQFLVATAVAPLLGAAPKRGRMVTYRDTGCSCCEAWVAQAREAGYAVAMHDLERVRRLRRFGLTEATAGCHTTQIDGYVVEGHVPLEIVARLLRERPHTRGIGIPGMPAGVGGMGGPRSGSVDVVTLDPHPRVYAIV